MTEVATAALLFGATASSAMAADPVRGKALYNNTNGAPLSCGTAGCHGPDPTLNTNKIRNGSTGAAVLNAINSVGAMSFLKTYVSAVDADDIAAYIVNPAAGTPSPAASLSTPSLSFGNQVVMTASGTMSATLRNSGTANLVVASIALAGTNPGDFTRGGTCAAATTLAPAQTCSIDVTFTPAVVGSRSATISVTHNATPSSNTLAVSGSGIAAPTPSVALSATSLAFGNQMVGSTSASKPVSINNTGSANLLLGAIALTGTNAADFAAAGCSGQTLAPGASCTVNVTFTPGALNARSATLSIPSNAGGSPHGVGLTGTGTAVPAPAVALNPTTLAFGNQTVG
ncbi:MAG TPA: choice-of-anchor D domain-containing protein, partial [Burkholderiaceae bacterium]|nr:choice-of-anchor D domain-containing protein [Burkholderiaceae bacterium]